MQSITIDIHLVKKLVATQFPQWKNLDIKPVIHGGWDNRTFHLGDQMLVRMPSAACYAEKVAKEQYWLPKLAPFLPLAIPTPVAMGQPSEKYPWQWSIYKWIEGDAAKTLFLTDDQDQLAFNQIDPTMLFN
jgi:aminoglycoside phosphotransferase (APT) family kinase protein